MNLISQASPSRSQERTLAATRLLDCLFDHSAQVESEDLLNLVNPGVINWLRRLDKRAQLLQFGF